eukprot:Rhum_TRINITY_DN14783_c8_g1::Rhum_TRINITY_DN14783_c8_g1_i2::g.118698::m.118698/K07090/K07090; uncharacterized protein
MLFQPSLQLLPLLHRHHHPPPPPMPAAAAAGIGACAGFAGSLVGLGGGFVAVPMMTNVLKLTQHQAHGTSLAVVAATGTAGAVSYGMSDHVDYTTALMLALGGSLTSPLGASLASRLPAPKLKIAMGCMQLAIAPLIPFKDAIVAKAGVLAKEAPPATASSSSSVDVRVQKAATMAAAGGAAGFLAGVFGVGGGAVLVPTLVYTCDMDYLSAVGTSLASMVLPAVWAGRKHYMLGNLKPRVAAPIAVGACVGTAVAAQLATHVLPEQELKYAFAACMAGMGAKVLLRI